MPWVHELRIAEEGATTVDRVLYLPATLTIAKVRELKDQVDERMLPNETFTLDVTELGRMDTAGAQFLQAVIRRGEELGVQIRWRGSSAAATRIAVSLGLNILRMNLAADGSRDPSSGRQSSTEEG